MPILLPKIKMTRITENTIEEFAIKLLEHLGYEYIYDSSISHDASTGSVTGESPERSSYEEVLLTNRMAVSIRRINPTVPSEAQEEAIKEIQRLNSPELLTNNESFHRLLTEGIKISYQKEGLDIPMILTPLGFMLKNAYDCHFYSYFLCKLSLLSSIQ